MEEGPFVVALTQNLEGTATVVWAVVAYNKKEAMAKARHLVLENKPPEYRCDPNRDSVAIIDLSVSPKSDILNDEKCEEWRREAGIYQKPAKRHLLEYSKHEKQEPLRIVDFRNAE